MGLCSNCPDIGAFKIMTIQDLAIIGGGINGVGIARDAAGRGLSVALYEQADLASATSSASTKLIHGGLRYLEHYAFALVRESLMERERLLRIAPHIIWPLRFVLPLEPGMRPAWLIRLGLFIYDHLGGRKILPPTRTLDLSRDEAGASLRTSLRRAFEYSDLWCQDARLVALNARDAANRGASIHTRCRILAARRIREGDTLCWRLELRDETTGASQIALARILINAAGPWAGDIAGHVMGLNIPARIRMVKGSHIVVPRLFAHDRAYIFQNRDNRIVFAIPYEGAFTLIGTTDRDYQDDPARAEAGTEEIAYLCAAVSEYFRKPVTPADVVWSYSGVRPLYDDGASKAQEATRDYVLHLDAPEGTAPSLSVFGGKLTTYRHLAESVLAKLAPHLPDAIREKPAWTMNEALPGGDFPHDGFDALLAGLRARAPFLPPPLAWRLARNYGTTTFDILGDARSFSDLGRDHGAGLTDREIDHLRRMEWAHAADDVLWRRSKLGLHMTRAQRDAVAALF